LRGSLLSEIRINSECQRFVCASQRSDIQVQVESVSSLSSQSHAPAFDSGAVWQLFRGASDLVFDFTSAPIGATPYKRMVVDRDFRRAHIALNRSLFPAHYPMLPMEYPTDELLITNYLAHHGLGIEVHGCGLIDEDGGGQLFLGHSGAGKSTTTRLWETFRDVHILSDDRVILRIHDGELWMYGTPWHGEAGFASSRRAKLNRIFILQHGRKNVARLLSRSQSVGEMFARSFPPFHSAEGMGGVLDFVDRALRIVPCYDFSFVPDRSAVDTVLNFHD
jgi:hypothetical protein